MTRAEKVAETHRLRAEGFKFREIGMRLGVATQTAHSYVSDPDLSKLAARKATYAPICEVCGAAMNGSAGLAGPRWGICMDCRAWSETEIVAAVQVWAAGHGGVPPTVQDWDLADATHPSSRTVCKRVGWNEALLRAGFGLRCDRRRETMDWILDQIREGVSVAEVARRTGTTPSNIYQRVQRQGYMVSELRRAA